jgi:hypothetical protein
MGTEPLADPVAEALRLISAAQAHGLIPRAIGGVAIYLQAREGQPRLPRRVKDIDLAAPAGCGRSVSRFLDAAGYQAGQMFNALRSGRRLLYRDWGLWRTCQRNIGRSLQDLGDSGLDPDEQKAVSGGLESLQARIDAEPKSMRWRMRSQVGDRVRWYQEPEEEQAGAE